MITIPTNSNPPTSLCQVLTLLADDFGIHEASTDTELLESGLLDSMAIVDLVLTLETAFAIRISDDDLQPDNFHSAGAMAALVDSRRVPLLATIAA